MEVHSTIWLPGHDACPPWILRDGRLSGIVLEVLEDMCCRVSYDKVGGAGMFFLECVGKHVLGQIQEAIGGNATLGWCRTTLSKCILDHSPGRPKDLPSGLHGELVKSS